MMFGSQLADLFFYFFSSLKMKASIRQRQIIGLRGKRTVCVLSN